MNFPARHPAHLELRPDIEKWTEVDDSLLTLLKKSTGIEGEYLQLASKLQPPLGYYKIISTTEEIFFLKILKRNDVESQLKADDVARWLSDQGVNTNCLINHSPGKISSRYAALVYPYIEGRYALPDISDMELLGESLAFLHEQLDQCPWQNEIIIRGITHHQKLTDLLIRLKKKFPIDSVPSEVISLLTEVESDLLDILIDSPQVIHGDLNYGNVLINSKGTRITFLDFEDTRVAWFSPLMELSYALERFSLTDDDEQSLVLSRSIYRSYRELGGMAYQYESHLSDILRALSVRALLLLTLVSNNDSWDVPQSEWDKFLVLYKQAINRKALLCQVIH